METQAAIREEEVDALVADVVRYMLFKNFQQPGVPMKREELTQIVTKNYRQRALPEHVINKAQGKLKQIFGVEVCELQKVRQQNRSGRIQAASSEPPKEYVLKSTVPAELRREYIDRNGATAARGLALAVIAIVSAERGKCPEETLWAHLQKLGIREDDDRHPTFGHVRSTMDAIIKQRYVQKEREGDGFVYALAEKALDAPLQEQLRKWIGELANDYCGIDSGLDLGDSDNEDSSRSE